MDVEREERKARKKNYATGAASPKRIAQRVTHEQIEAATAEFLARGGVIKKVKPTPNIIAR